MIIKKVKAENLMFLWVRFQDHYCNNYIKCSVIPKKTVNVYDGIIVVYATAAIVHNCIKKAFDYV